MTTREIAKLIYNDKYNKNVMPPKPKGYTKDSAEYLKAIKKLIIPPADAADDLDYILLGHIKSPILYTDYLGTIPAKLQIGFGDYIAKMEKDPYTKAVRKYMKNNAKTTSVFYEGYKKMEAYTTLLYSLFLEGESAKRVIDKLQTKRKIDARDLTAKETLALKDILSNMITQLGIIIKEKNL